MDSFGDKKIEINQLIKYVTQIVKEYESKWTVNAETYSVTINDSINRTFPKAELESFEQQIKYLQANLQDTDDFDVNSKEFNSFLEILKNIKNKYKICRNPFCLVHNPAFICDQFRFYEDELSANDFPFPKMQDDDRINPAIDSFGFGYKEYYSFGKAILEGYENDNNREILSVLFSIVAGSQIDTNLIDNFREVSLIQMQSLDPIRIGRNFVSRILEDRNNYKYDYKKFPDCSALSKGSFQKLSQFVHKFSSECTLLIAKVPKPAHTFHLIQPAYVLLNSKNSIISRYQCPRENIIFCTENQNFQKSLNRLMNRNDNSSYFIVHPENLKSDEIQSLISFILARRTQDIKQDDGNDQKENDSKSNSKKKSSKTKTKSKEKGKEVQTLPNVIIITALPPSFFSKDDSSYCEEFVEEDIQEFATFNAKWRNFAEINNDAFLISSSQPGIGKTYNINKILNKYQNLKFVNEEKEEETVEIKSDHIYFDITTAEIPERIKNLHLIHVSISPELFLNNFNIMDQFYLLIQYGYFIFQSGSQISYNINFNIKPTFLIEIPNLSEDNSLKHFYDFPVAPSNNETPKEKPTKAHQNYSFYSDIVEQFKKDDYSKNGIFTLDSNDNKMKIDEDAQELIKLVFKEEIENCEQLIEKAQSLFYPGEEFENKKYNKDNRILSKIEKMLNDYSKLINEEKDKEKKEILSLLTIRTILYIWHFTPKTSKSLFIIVPKRLMTKYAFKPKNGWIIVSLLSKSDKDKNWKTQDTNISDITSNQKLFDKIKDFEKNVKPDENFHFLTADIKNAENDLALQTRFFKTILLFLPDVSFESNASNPLKIATILLSLFSDLDHYPEDKFRHVVELFQNQNYSLEDIKDNFKNLGLKTEWSEIDELLAEYFKVNSDIKIPNINELIIKLKSELSKYENIWNIIKISFSKTYFCRFIEIILKIYYQHFCILQGDTGCGKTSVINLLNDVLTLAKNDERKSSDVNWSFYMIDFHGNFTQDDFEKKIAYIETNESVNSGRENNSNEKIIIFLDELNTSPAYYYVIDQIQNKTNKFFSFIAAINAKDVVPLLSQDLSRVGIRQKINLQLSHIKLFSTPPNNIESLTYIDEHHYAYNVKEDQESVKSSIIYSDPQEFDEDNDTEEYHISNKNAIAKHLPDEEKNAIRSIITKLLLQWENSKYIDLTKVIDLMSKLINRIFVSVRSFMDLRAVFSYRDVHRCITIFTYIFDFFLKNILKDKDKKKLFLSNIKYKQRVTSISIVVSIYISLISRFSHEKIKLTEEIEQRFNLVTGFKETDPFSMYEIILKYAQDSEELFVSYNFPYFNNWEQVSILFAYAKCMKYIEFVKNQDIYPLPSLMLHLLILSLTISASSYDINKKDGRQKSTDNSSFFTCLIIGMPGTSKSKAIEIYKNYHLNKKNKKHQYFISTYLCSRTSDSNSLLAQFLNGAKFLKETNYKDTKNGIKSKKAIVVLEEVGLANYNPSRPLKILHPLCDKGVQISNGETTEYCKIIPVQLSNYAIDFANMNRGFLVCAGLPTDEELSLSISFGKQLNKLNIKKEFTQTLIKMMCNDDEENKCEELHNYRDIIKYLLNQELFGEIETNTSNEKGGKSGKGGRGGKGGKGGRGPKKENPESKRGFENILIDLDTDTDFYKKIFQALWSATQKGAERPDFFPMRPLFNIIKLISGFLKDKSIDDKKLEILSSSLNSFILDKDIIDKSVIKNDELLNKILEPLNLGKSIEAKINPIKLYYSFFDIESQRKALLIRTQDYEAYRYFHLLSNKDFTNFQSNIINNFVPFEYQDVGEDCQHKFDNLFSYLCSNHEEQEEEEEVETQNIFISIGNDPFSDYIIDILNGINQDGQCPTAILQGFPVYLPNFPNKIKFIFIINNSDIYNQELRNPVPFPLIDRLDHVFLDKQILYKYEDYLLQTTNINNTLIKYLLEPDTEEDTSVKKQKKDTKPKKGKDTKPKKGKDAKKGKDTKKGKDEDEDEDEDKDEDKDKKSPKLSKSDFLLTYYKSDFEYLKDALKNEGKGEEILNNHFENTSMKSLNELIEKVQKIPKECNLNTAVVFTKTPFYESFDFDGKPKFEIIFDDHNTLNQKLKKVKHNKSILIRSDVFNLPDDNTLNNSLSIINSLTNKIIENAMYYPDDEEEEEANEDGDNKEQYEEYGMNKYIIVFHVNKNQIPKSFGHTTVFPAVWIESLPASSEGNLPLIQEICTAILNGKVSSDSPIIKKSYEKMAVDIKEKFPDKDKNKISEIFTKGIKIKKNTYKIDDVFGILEKHKAEQSSSQGQKKVTLDALKDNIKKQLDDIENESDPEKASQLEDDLNSKNLEIEFFKNISGLVDDTLSASLYVILKYISKIESTKTEKRAIDDFVEHVFECIPKINTLIPIQDDTFKSENEKNEVNTKKPELIFYNCLKKFFSVDIYYNSLNLMKKLLENLHQVAVSDVFRYINDNYTKYNQVMPYEDRDQKISIDDFSDYFNTRGMLEGKDGKDAFEFIKQLEDGTRPNLRPMKIDMKNIRGDMNNDKYDDLRYKQILLSDCYDNYMNEQEDIKLLPHPILIYHHFIKIKDFSFDKYQEEEGKIFKNELIPWIINFFLYGSFNDCILPGKESSYLNNLTNFIDLGIDFDLTFKSKVLNSKEVCHFAYDCLFTEFCKKEPKEKIESFAYADYIGAEPPKEDHEKIDIFNFQNDEHVKEFKLFITNDKPSEEVVKKEIEGGTDYDVLSDQSKEAIRTNFKEIEDIEKAIKYYEEWKKNSLDELANNNLFDNVRSKLFKTKEIKASNEIKDKFGCWFLNTSIPLFTRQVYEVCKAIKSADDNRIQREFSILKRIINPWNNDDRPLKAFWKDFVQSNPFDSLRDFSKAIKDKLQIYDIIKNCQPYYFCEYEENVEVKAEGGKEAKAEGGEEAKAEGGEEAKAEGGEDAKAEGGGKSTTKTIKKTVCLARNVSVKTYFIERCLYSLTILENNVDVRTTEQLFNFMSNLPFVRYTKHLYILAGFVNEILRDFRDQINLLYLVLETCENCVDLMEVDNFKPIINNAKRTESPDSLKEALQAADGYGEGENCTAKLKSYINRLIEINNNTILSPEKKGIVNKLKYRLIAKSNTHSNLSLMNTFLPALAHLKFESNKSPSDLLVNAYKVLIGKDVDDLIPPAKDKFYKDVPSIFLFEKGSPVRNLMITIPEIGDDVDLFGLPKDSMILCLNDELASFLKDEANKESYRAKIWEKIVNSPKTDKKIEYPKILKTLIPLFEEYDAKLCKEHLFFSTAGWKDNEKLPDNLEGVEDAANFLKTRKINKLTIFEEIQNLIPPPEESE